MLIVITEKKREIKKKKSIKEIANVYVYGRSVCIIANGKWQYIYASTGSS